MRCTQVAQLLNDGRSVNTPEIQDHITRCTECRDVWEAERVLTRNLSTMRADTPSAPTWNETQVWLDRTLTEEKEYPVRSILRHPLSTRPRRWGFSLAAATVALALFVLVPFPYEHTVGTQLVLTSADPALARIDTGVFEARFTEGGLSGTSVMTARFANGSSLTYFVPGSHDDAMAAFAATRDLLPALTAPPGVEITPWRVRESGSLLAQIGSGTFSLTVDITGKTEAEIEAEVREQLLAQGARIDKIWISKDDAGGTFSMDLEGQVGLPGGEEAQFQLKEVVTGYDLDHGQISTSLFIEEFDPNMSDEEILADIKRRLADRGITDATVTITDGKIEVTCKEFIER